MRKRRLVTTCAAFALALLSVLAVPADAVVLEKVHIVFGTNTAVDNVTASIIRGSAVVISAKNTQYYALKGGSGDKALNIVAAADGASGGAQSGYFTITGDKNQMKVTPILSANLAAGVDKTKAAQGDYTVTTNFSSYQYQAQASRKDSGGGEAGKFEMVLTKAELDMPSTWLPIQTNAKMVLRYEEAADGTPKFTVDTTTATGIFRECTVDSFTLEKEGNDKQKEQWFITLKMGADSGLGTEARKKFLFEPNQKAKTGTDSAGNPIYDYTIQKDSLYEISYSYDQSNQLMLTVLDPQDVLDKLTDSCKEYALDKNQYIKVIGANDDLRYLTDRLELVTRTELYGEKVMMEWKWVPKDPKDENAVTITRRNDAQSDAIVTMAEKDVEGCLRVTATYVTEELRKDVAGNALTCDNGHTEALIPGRIQKDIPITIHGRGTPAVITQESQWIGGEKEPDKTLHDTPLPQNPVKMDVYRNTVPGWTATKKPFQYTLGINMGKDNGMTKQMVIDVVSGDGSSVTPLITLEGTDTPYTFGTPFHNDKLRPWGTVSFTAEKGASSLLTLKFRFFVAGKNGALREEKTAERQLTLRVDDSSPSRIAALSDFTILDATTKDPVSGFTFDPAIKAYEISLPYASESVMIRPTNHTDSQVYMGFDLGVYNDLAVWERPTATSKYSQLFTGCLDKEKKWVIDWPSDGKVDWEAGGPNFDYSITSGAGATMPSRTLQKLPAGRQVKVTIKVRAQNPNIVEAYTFILTRMNPSTDSTLAGLNLFGRDKTDYVTAFQPTKREYQVRVPFRVDELRPEFLPTHVGAKGTITVENTVANPEAPIPPSGVIASGDWVKIKPPGEKGYSDANPPTKITVTVQSEYDQCKPVGSTDDYVRTYTIEVRRNEPNDVATLSALNVLNEAGTTINYTPVFHADMVKGDYYELDIPYTTQKLKLTAKTTDPYASAAAVKAGEGDTDVPIPAGAPSASIVIPRAKSETEAFVLTVRATAENQADFVDYPIHIYRALPNKDATLKTLTLADQDGAAISYEFLPDEESYDISVPYETKKVTFTPTATDPNIVSIILNPPDGRKLLSGTASPMQELGFPNTAFVIEVSPEDNQAPKKTYRLNIKRESPSDDARLLSLTLSGIDPKSFAPVFAPATLNYKADVADGAKAVTVTPTANYPKATLTVDGKRVVNGQASAPINLLEVRQKIEIVVTAQDGKSTRTYTVTLYNGNLVPKNNDADLDSLKVNYGSMTPRFQPSTTIYDVAVAEDVSSVELVPVTADSGAKLRVYSASKEIGDRAGNFSEYITDGQNEFVIEVTASDGKAKKEYTVNVYRNEEEKLGNLKVITSDSINYEVDPIVVDISKYSRIQADVFNKLMEYPKKTILFQGNDYSIQFSSDDFKRQIPNTTIYDLGMIFSTPFQSQIEDQIFYSNHPNNEMLEPVYVHFRHEGALPAPAHLMLSLGSPYRSRTMHWHYYNEERDRIDYYGYVATNSRGTLSLTLDHFSTYIFTEKRIEGSENKAPADPNLENSVEVVKVNPTTGSAGDRP